MSTALDYAKQIKDKRISVEELVSATIEKIETLNSNLQAVVSKRYEKALIEARTRDFSNQLFGGVPILLKDLSQHLKGEKNTAGSKLLQNVYSTYTDYFVQSLQNLGFIVVGQTATPEYGFKNYTQSDLYGTTRNPLDRSRHAGGSSGGAASAVASGMVPIASASDGGGSIRIPASWTGLIGLKPTRGRMPVGPYHYRSWQGASIHFALSQDLQDTKALFYGMQTEQWDSPFTLPKNYSSVLGRLKIAYSLNSPVGTPVSQSAKEAVLKTVRILSDLGHDVSEKEPALDGITLMESYYVMNSVETANMFFSLEKSLQRTIRKEDMEVMTWLIYQAGKDVKASDYSAILSLWDETSAMMYHFHKNYDVFITPTTATHAPKIDEYGVDSHLNDIAEHITEFSQEEKEKIVWDMFLPGLTLTPFTQQVNLTGQPAISLPVYQNEKGLPLGVQCTASKGREDILFFIAEQLEFSWKQK
ncbi:MULTISPECIES: amidase [unclassified Granulicatella]|uniref:amidase n=1 Tax=unclassified Granulicatella TaxID=2630493 RepID=UPI0010739AFB|nr:MULTISPECIES: amidase [unclassified Granulicatella]MBF0780835.1 amidase [Granulicatella sp. 19428wC4_WM01]TFU93522.1 amidase [Granulicatella sp. WM01]